MHTQVKKIAQSAKRVLIAPLDWGLGHATRCIPIIRELLNHNVEVYIATSGKIKTLLKVEFPQANFLDLKGYNIQYSKTSKCFSINIFKQIPKILSIVGAMSASFPSFNVTPSVWFDTYINGTSFVV